MSTKKIKLFVRESVLDALEKNPDLIMRAGACVTEVFIVNEENIKDYPITIGDNKLVEMEMEKC